MNESSRQRLFVDTEFCYDCGTIMPYPTEGSASVHCLCCKKIWKLPDEPRIVVCTHKLKYNKERSGAADVEKNEKRGAAEGPTVMRVCSKCSHNVMSYSTVQTRSADEGMTVFYTCVQCGHKDIDYT